MLLTGLSTHWPKPVGNSQPRLPLVLRSFCERCLPRVVRSVAGAIHHDGKPVAHRILDEIIIGNCCVLLQPVLQCEPFEGSSEFVTDLGPCFPKFGCREWIGKRAVQIRDIRLVQLSVKSLPNAK